jgi:hypothetical protein
MNRVGQLFFGYIYYTKARCFLSKEEFEDTKGVIIIRISKNRQHNGQNKSTKSDLLNIHIKLKIE